MKGMKGMKGKRFVCLLLSLALLVTSCITALALDKDAMPQYKTYTVLGDSQAAGYGLESYYKAANHPTDYYHGNADGQRISGSYADQIATAVGAETVNCCAHSGWRIQELLYALDHETYQDVYDNYLYTALHRVERETIDAAVPAIAPAIKDADLITLQFGQNDILTAALVDTFDYVNRELGGFDFPDIKGIDGLAAAYAAMTQTAEELGKVKEFVAKFEECLDNNCESFKQYLPKLIQTIRTMNKDADIVVLGISNPLTTNASVALIDLLDIRLAKLNSYIKNDCPCRNEYAFCDVSATTNYGTKVLDWDKLLNGDIEELKYSAVRMIHPTEKGHDYIAKQLKSVLQANTVCPTATAQYGLLHRSQIKWDRVKGALGYRIYRSTNGGESYCCIGTSVNNLFIDHTAPRGTLCCYTVRAAMDAKGTLSAASNVVSLAAIR